MHCVFQIFSTQYQDIYVHIYTIYMVPYVCIDIESIWDFIDETRLHARCEIFAVNSIRVFFFLWQIGIVFESLRQVLMGKCVYRALYKRRQKKSTTAILVTTTTALIVLND